MKAKSAILLLTAYLVICTVLSQLGISFVWGALMYLLAPVLIIWMVYTVLTDDSQYYPELNEKDAWGYRDKRKEELGLM